jgi:hypothetical protein
MPSLIHGRAGRREPDRAVRVSFKLLDNPSITPRPIVAFIYERQLDVANAQFIIEQALMHIIDIRMNVGARSGLTRRLRRRATGEASAFNQLAYLLAERG